MGGDTALAIGKGFDQDQIVKSKDACGVCNAQQILAIWSVIQSTKGKSFDTYRAHIAKSLDLWCRSHHINHDKLIFLEAKFFEDLVALRFNPGGRLLSSTRWCEGCRCWPAAHRQQWQQNLVESMRRRLKARSTPVALMTYSKGIAERLSNRPKPTRTSN